MAIKARSPEQLVAAELRPQYNVYPDRFRNAVKWKIERVHADGAITAIGDAPSRKAAKLIACLLAGFRGDVTVCRTAP